MTSNNACEPGEQLIPRAIDNAVVDGHCPKTISSKRT